MDEFWLIALPGEPSPAEALAKIDQETAGQNEWSRHRKWNLPDMKVGTLDTLVSLSEDLAKYDVFAESVTRKMAQYLCEVLESEQKDTLEDNLRVNDKSVDEYLAKFQWDSARFPTRHSPKSISEMILKQISQIDSELKTKSTAYNQLKANLSSLERKQTGNLLTRSLIDLVNKKDFVLDSEYLATLLVVVPKSGYKDWNLKYEKLSDMVVPRSTKKIHEDGEHGLYTVTLFKKVVDEYKLHARENKFIVRDFVFDTSAQQAERQEINRLQSDRKRQYAPLIRWLNVNFSEAFAGWIHIKALRVFVESVLRYGLPVNFRAILTKPHKKAQKKIREKLMDLYGLQGGLDMGSGGGKKDRDIVDIPGLSMIGQQDYYPYVFFPIKVELMDR
ncbi:V-type proton ATPase subunit C 1-B-like [Oscarella lobularis]|uniref:V-type proton ATPase subunit C 1-B-like n=1 Tax=Oscarella lobularis TaxID=121494 RepID=UPI0033138A4E